MSNMSPEKKLISTVYNNIVYTYNNIDYQCKPSILNK